MVFLLPIKIHFKGPCLGGGAAEATLVPAEGNEMEGRTEGGKHLSPIPQKELRQKTDDPSEAKLRNQSSFVIISRSKGDGGIFMQKVFPIYRKEKR